jgi:hypothetical protein
LTHEQLADKIQKKKESTRHCERADLNTRCI